MRRVLLAILLSLFAVPAFAQGAPPQAAANQPYAIEYYYKVQWGHQQEFLSLFLKNHYPLLKKIVETGRMTCVKIESPAYHTTEDGRWDYRVTITYPNSTAGHHRQSRRRSSDQAALSRSGQLTSARSSAASRYWSRTGTCRSPTSLRRSSGCAPSASFSFKPCSIRRPSEHAHRALQANPR